MEYLGSRFISTSAQLIDVNVWGAGSNAGGKWLFSPEFFLVVKPGEKGDHLFFHSETWSGDVVGKVTVVWGWEGEDEVLTSLLPIEREKTLEEC